MGAADSFLNNNGNGDIDLITHSLNGNWRFRQAGNFHLFDAMVPDSLLLDLMRLGQVPDSYYRDREYGVLARFEVDY